MSGTAVTPQTFTQLLCSNEQYFTPHRAGRVLAQLGKQVELELYCRQCGNKTVNTMYELPVGYRTYQVRVVGEDNPALPVELRPQPLPFLADDFAVVARSAQEAHEQAGFTHKLPFCGHLVTYYVDGVEHWDERF
jgi:hypothetical protein